MEFTNTHQALAAIASRAAIGDIDGLTKYLHKCFDDTSLTLNQAKSALEQLYAYCGFPRSLNALTALMNVVKERNERGLFTEIGQELKNPNLEVSAEEGTKTLIALTGSSARAELYNFVPRIDFYLKSHLFGDIFADTRLTYIEREIVTISILSSLDGVEHQLESHTNIGKRNGLTDEDVKEIYKIANKD